MKTLSPEQLRLLCDAAHDAAQAARFIGHLGPSADWVDRVAERAAVNLDQVLMELDDE